MGGRRYHPQKTQKKKEPDKHRISYKAKPLKAKNEREIRTSPNPNMFQT